MLTNGNNVRGLLKTQIGEVTILQELQILSLLLTGTQDPGE